MAKGEIHTIHIDDEWFIIVDELNWTLHCIKQTDQTKKIVKNETRDVTIGYYCNLKECIKAYIEYKNINDTEDIKDLNQYCIFVENNNNKTVEKIYNMLNK